MLEQTTINRIKTVLRNSIDHHELAGANLLVIKEGKEIFYHEDGYADSVSMTPIQRNSIFRLYSMSKPVTAVAVMILVERGQIDLFDAVSKYLPGFKNQRVEHEGRLIPVNREMTIKDLLYMTSGLVYGGENKAGQETEALFQEIDQRLLGQSPMTTLEIMNKLGGCTLAFQPGSSWQYGTSADVLGGIVEVVSKKRFGEFLYEALFKPLNMMDTGFFVPDDKRNRLVHTYADNGEGLLMPYTGNHLGINNQMDRQPAFESGGAGLVSTIDDYAKFTQMLMNKGILEDVRILMPKTVKYLTTGSLDSNQQKSFEQWATLSGHSYGSLMRVMKDCGQAGFLGSMGEYGWDGWLGAYFCNCPEEDLTILLMMQKKDAGTTALTRKVRNVIMSAV